MERFSDFFSDHPVKTHGRIENNRFQLIQIDFSIRQDLLIHLHGNDLSDQQFCFRIPLFHGAFQRQRVFFNDRSVDMSTGMDMNAGFLDLVFLMSGSYTEKIGNGDGIRGSESDSECTCLFEVFSRFMLAEYNDDLVRIFLCASGCIHGIGNTILVVGCNNEYCFRCNNCFLTFKFHLWAPFFDQV